MTVINKKTIFILALFFLCCNKTGSPRQEVTLVAVGDIMLGRYIAKMMKTSGNDLPFQRITSTLREADVVFGNLEGVISPDDVAPAYPDKPYNFHATNDAAPALQKAGFTILTLANNHAMDYGSGQLLKTKTLLLKNGIYSFGAGRDIQEAHQPVLITVGKVRFGFLGYGVAHSGRVYAEKNRAGIASISADAIQRDIMALRNKVDVLVISLHWGIEYENKPTERQRAVAHRIIDWGADMIIGHHPHVMQGIEIYKGKLIAYSLGNFVFDQRGQGTDRSFMLACKFRRNVLYSAQIIPLDRFRYYFPKIAEGEEKEHILSDLKAMSLSINEHAYALSKVGLTQ